jgi:hypothetical protein
MLFAEFCKTLNDVYCLQMLSTDIYFRVLYGINLYANGVQMENKKEAQSLLTY